ncbi:SpoIIE family protein phosphatase [Streptomyces sp. 3MP-14]|uniref:SpoIIE family protein phosphatase n=1 Tax=Streptomyces mimosae TaxID=2586635 RepID=A0A5N6ALC6_9ACTN|nr:MULTISPECIES: ATP-binding protein [Streptomyces]KAB8168876.1 SpoIIE family protein phosphatase [Streptomyces mimosae]KAB8177845.1 SpoIIE family protein phosphatase [Streptomyces sp. 3MP-14]
MTAATPPRLTRQVRIDHHSATHLALVAARELAHALRLPGAGPERAAVLASELATNLDKHAHDGALYLQPLPLGGGLELVAVDRGPGIPDVHAALADGFSTSGTLGGGLGAVRRIADQLTIHSDPGGTLVRATLAAPDAGPDTAPPPGAVCLPTGAEGADGADPAACGDAFAVRDTPAGRTVAVIDALGHGPEAERAALAALAAFDADPALPLRTLLERQHRALRRTRGAAIALLRLTERAAEFAAVGNVRLVRFGLGRPRAGPPGPPGIVGYTLPRLTVHRLPRVPGETLLLHTDGIHPDWSGHPARLDPPAEPPTSPVPLPPTSPVPLPPALLAPFLAHRHRRPRDDATAVAIPT